MHPAHSRSPHNDLALASLLSQACHQLQEAGQGPGKAMLQFTTRLRRVHQACPATGPSGLSLLPTQHQLTSLFFVSLLLPPAEIRRSVINITYNAAPMIQTPLHPCSGEEYKHNRIWTMRPDLTRCPCFRGEYLYNLEGDQVSG